MPNSDADLPKFKVYKDGESIPPVDPEDIKRFWKVKPPWRPGNDVESACSPGADVVAVYRRWMMIQALITLKLLSPWQQGEELDDAVFRIAATFPMQYLEHKSYQLPGDLLHPFDPNAFIQRLIEETGISHTWKPVDIRAPEGSRCFLMADVLQSQDPKKNIDPEITAKHRTRQFLWGIWERCSGRSDLKDHPEALAGFFADYLIENLDLVREATVPPLSVRGNRC
jgi:hypothetical protein